MNSLRCNLAVLGLLLAPIAQAQGAWLPLSPGTARCQVSDGVAWLENSALKIAVSLRDGELRPQSFDNQFSRISQPLGGELFTLRLRDGQRITASSMNLTGTLSCEREPAAPAATRSAARHPAQALHAVLEDKRTALIIDWRLILRDGANYAREEIRLKPEHELDLATVDLIDLQLLDASVAGTVDGSPIVAKERFFGFEHPMAAASVLSGHALASLKRTVPLRSGIGVSYSAVFGVAPEGQLRRAFLNYLEEERAHPFRTFLHYNSWYDIGYFTPYTQEDALKAINAFGDQLVRKRNVRMDSFLFDDGWDDTSALWQFNSGFPRGFAPLAEAAARFGAAPGIWLSPWGGYGAPRKARLQTARSHGYEVDDQGLALSGPKYYGLFHRVTLDLLQNYGINQFKLDGTGSPDKVTPGSEFDSDFAAAITLIDDLRQKQPDLFINLTTGTWPSPFWLRTVDSIWRGGDDHAFAGEGSNRQRWITYRDAGTYGGIVRQGWLYPLNSLMLHGVIYARHAQGLDSDPGHDFSDELWSYFASGTGLQELYISPDLLSDRDWNELAAAARWSRARAGTLRDSHWLGGDPARGQVYGWASWSPAGAVVALRNPTNRPQSFALDLAAALELPPGAARSWHVNNPRRAAKPLSWSADRPVVVRLQPYEVRVWDLQPP
jgi:hypothetical protein